MMRFKDTLLIILLFFGLVTPILYFLGLLYTAGWEAYWGIPQGLFELDFHTVIVTGPIYILDVLVWFIGILIKFIGILLGGLIKLIGIIIVGLIKNWPIVKPLLKRVDNLVQDISQKRPEEIFIGFFVIS